MDVEVPEGAGFDATRMPTKTEVTYVKYWHYDEAAKSFTYEEQSTFDNLEENWYKGDFPTKDRDLTSDFRKS